MYPSLLGSGFLDRLLSKGVKYLFVSNSDNLGATLSVDLLAYFAKTDKAFLMEVRLVNRFVELNTREVVVYWWGWGPGGGGASLQKHLRI